MILNLSDQGLVKLEVIGDKLLSYSNEGIKFTNSLEEITALDCSGNYLCSLPLLPDSLKYLGCDKNQISELPALPKSLLRLRCSHNKLKTLPKLPEALKELRCHKNELTAVPPLPNTLEIFHCDDNQLKTLPAVPKNLKDFNCYNNPLLFIRPIKGIHVKLIVPNHLFHLYFNHHDLVYHKRYETYIYLISFLTLDRKLLPSLFLNEAWWFPGLTQA